MLNDYPRRYDSRRQHSVTSIFIIRDCVGRGVPAARVPADDPNVHDDVLRVLRVLQMPQCSHEGLTSPSTICVKLSDLYCTLHIVHYSSTVQCSAVTVLFTTVQYCTLYIIEYYTVYTIFISLLFRLMRENGNVSSSSPQESESEI